VAIIDLSMVIGAIIEMGAEGVWEKAKRREAVIRVLKKAGLDPDAPPRDFDGVYAYTLVEYGVGKPKPVLGFFRHEFIKQAFRKSFEQRDLFILDNEAENLLDWSEVGAELRRMDIDPRHEFARFTAVFHTLADRTRMVAEVKRDQKLEDVHGAVQDVVARLEVLDELPKLRAELERLRRSLTQKETKGAMPPQPSIISDKNDFYLVKEGNMHYILDNPTLRYVESLGLRIIRLSSEKMRQLPFSRGDTLRSRAPRIVQDSRGTRYLVVIREEKRQIPNDETLEALGGDPSISVPTEDEYLASLREGLPLSEQMGEQWFTSKPKLEKYVVAEYTSGFLVCGQICRYISKPKWVKELRERLGIGSIEPIDRQKLESYVEGIPIDSERDAQTVLFQLCARGSGGAPVRN
jgi:hypothetical protein